MARASRLLLAAAVAVGCALGARPAAADPTIDFDLNTPAGIVPDPIAAADIVPLSAFDPRIDPLDASGNVLYLHNNGGISAYLIPYDFPGADGFNLTAEIYFMTDGGGAFYTFNGNWMTGPNFLGSPGLTNLTAPGGVTYDQGQAGFIKLNNIGPVAPGGSGVLAFFIQSPTGSDTALLIDRIRPNPEPGTMALLGIAGAGCWIRRRRRKA